jgi:hypothetical protein
VQLGKEAKMPIDMGSISALVTSLQSAVEIARVMKNLRDTSTIQGKVIDHPLSTAPTRQAVRLPADS